jgi:hypothetical protein
MFEEIPQRFPFFLVQVPGILAKGMPVAFELLAAVLSSSGGLPPERLLCTPPTNRSRPSAPFAGSAVGSSVENRPPPPFRAQAERPGSQFPPLGTVR